MWPRLGNLLLGLWLIAAPAVLGYGDPARANDRIVGPVVASLAAIAIWEVTRPLRWVNLALGGWLLVAPWLLGYGGEATANSTVVGALVAAFAAVRGRRSGRFGGGWSALWRSGGAAPDGG